MTAENPNISGGPEPFDEGQQPYEPKNLPPEVRERIIEALTTKGIRGCTVSDTVLQKLDSIAQDILDIDFSRGINTFSVSLNRNLTNTTLLFGTNNNLGNKNGLMHIDDITTISDIFRSTLPPINFRRV